MNNWYRLIRFSRRSGVRTRLIFAFLLVSILPLALTGAIAYHKSNQAIGSNTSTYSAEILQLLQNKINDEVRQYETFADQVMLNDRIQDGLVHFAAKSEVERGDLQVYIEQNVLGANFWILSMIKSLQLQTVDGGLLYDYAFDTLTAADIERLKADAERSGQIDTWSYGATIAGEPCLTLIRAIPNAAAADGTLGYLIMGIDERLFSDLVYNDIDLGKGSQLVLMNDAGEILSSKSDRFRSGQVEASNDPLRAWMAPGRPDGSLRLGSVRYFASYAHDEALKWNLLALIPYAYLDAKSNGIALTIATVIVVCLLFCLLLTALISSSIATPLRKLHQAAGRIGDGNFRVVVKDEGQDEIAYLSGKFNEMMQELKQLIGKVREEQANKREAELKMLQAQINPHFLFNTLNSLRWAALLSQANSVGDGLGALSELLRHTIFDRDEQVTLRDELNHIANYVIIQQVRYGTSLRIEQKVPPELTNALVLKFLLQPIVENAILHGFDDADRQPLVTIEAERVGQLLRIAVRDNGKGLEAERVRRLMSPQAEATGGRLSGIGLGNVRERIRLHYGPAYGLAIASEPGQGTEVVLSIPYVEKEGA